MVPLAELPYVRRIRYLDALDSTMSGLYWKVEYGAGVRSYPEYLAWLGDRDVWECSESTPG